MPKIQRRRRFPVHQLLASLALLVGLSLVYATKPAGASETRLAALSTELTSAPGGPGDTATKAATGLETGLALPRFVSLKFKSTNLRVGPGTKYPVSWAYNREGLPVEVIQEFGR